MIWSKILAAQFDFWFFVAILADMKALRISAVSALTGLAVQTIRNKTSRGEFPRPYKPSTTVAVWDEAELVQWMKNKKGDCNGKVVRDV